MTSDTPHSMNGGSESTTMTTRKQPIRRLAFLSSWASVLAIAAWLTIIGSSIGASSAFVVRFPTTTTTTTTTTKTSAVVGRSSGRSCSNIVVPTVTVTVTAAPQQQSRVPPPFGFFSTQLYNQQNDNTNSGSSSSSSNNDDLLEKARKLREEASVLEDNLRATKPKTASPVSASDKASVPTVVTRLEGSTWTVSYRFSSQPDPKTKNNNNGDDGRAPGPKTFYSGKLTLLLKADGYSERLVQAEDDTSAGGGADNDIKITKIWGWDRETSNEDDLDYLLFSMDVVFPASDPETPGKTDRYYLQARIEESNNGGGIALKDGTITVKKDVTETTGGMWGLFNVAGILTEFRYCGDFAARPAAR